MSNKKRAKSNEQQATSKKFSLEVRQQILDIENQLRLLELAKMFQNNPEYISFKTKLDNVYEKISKIFKISKVRAKKG